MMMHDHTKRPAGGYYCPLMRGICVDGWTKEMGEGTDGRRPTCISWRPVTVMNGGPKGRQEQVFDCTIGWLPDLLVQVADETYSGAVAMEQTRNKVSEQRSFFKQLAVATMALARRNGVTRE